MSLFDFFGMISNRDLHRKLECIENKLSYISDQSRKRDELMAIDLSALIEQVARNAEVDVAAMTLITGLKAQIDQLVIDLADQPVIAAKIAELAAALDASTDALAAAVITPPVVEEPVIEEPVIEEPVEPIVE